MERLKRTGAEIALRSVREADLQARLAEVQDVERLRAALDSARRQNATLVDTLEGVRDYCYRQRKRSRVAARVAKVAAAALTRTGPTVVH